MSFATLALVALAIAPATPGRSTQPPAIHRHVTPNGLEVLVVENHSVPLVTVEIAAHNGSMTEPPEYNGLSHLYEHMFFKANQAIPSQEAWLARARELGLSWNGTTQTERANYFLSTTSDHLDDTLVFMRDAVVGPLFDPKELERERVVVTGEIDRNESNPYYHFFHDLLTHIWPKYSSRKDPLGKRSTVLAATRKKMQTIQQRYYIPNNSVLVVTGDVSADDVFAKVDKLFADWKRGPDPFKKFPLVKHPPLRRSEVVVVEQPMHTVVGQITWHGPSTVGPDVPLTYAADLVGTAMNEPASRFQRDLVDSGACVRAGFGWFTQRNVGPINLFFEAAPDKVDECVKAIFAELPRLKEESTFSDEELHNAAHELEVSQVLERERPSELAHVLTFWWASAGVDYYLGYVDHLYAVTRADIASYLDKFVYGKPYVFGIMLSPELRAKGLDQAHFETLLGLKPPRHAQAGGGR